MQLTPVESSNIAAIGFEPGDAETDTLTLYVRFKSGNTFRYADVPRERYNAMMTAKSKGRYFAAQIRKRFKGELVPVDCPANVPEDCFASDADMAPVEEHHDPAHGV